MHINFADYILLIYPLSLLFLTFYKSKLYKGTEFPVEIWDRNQAKMMQAVACIGVILHHLTQRITSYGSINHGPITLLASMGILFTSIFFFFTGYGLIVSVLNNPDYLNRFLIHRLSTVLIPFFTANTVCVILRIYYSNIPTSSLDILRAILGFTLLNGNGWYIVEVFFLYLIFYILFKFIKKKDIAIILLCVASILLIRYSHSLGHDHSDIGDRPFYGEWWYNSTIVFTMGVLFARFKNSIVSFVKKHYTLILIFTTVLFIISFVIEERILKTRGYYNESFTIDGISNSLVTLISQMILCIIFTFLVLLINLKVQIGNRILKGISSISMEIFLIHGIFLNTIFDFSRVNYFKMYAIVIACSIPAAMLMHLINAPICKFIQSYKPKKKYHTAEGAKAFENESVRKGKIKKTATIVALFVFIFSCAYYSFFSVIRPSYECKSELRTLYEAKEGDIVYFGRYETILHNPGKERVSWIVLKRDDNKIMLISKEGLAGSAYFERHAVTNWDNSEIRLLVNGVMYDDMFSNYEKQHIIRDANSGDVVTLLTVEEANDYFDDNIARQLISTDIAIRNGTNINTFSKVNYWDTLDYNTSWWWLKGTSDDITAPIVSVDGEILTNSQFVNRPNGAVRPVIFVSIE